jgi:hypothetical protein
MTDQPIRSYPLQWPPGVPRTASASRTRAPFNRRERNHSGGYSMRRSLSVIDGVNRVLEQLRHMRVSRDESVISTNMPSRLDGLPRSDSAQPADTGAAVYWRKHGETPRCMAIDIYDGVADNLAAIAQCLEAIRTLERVGGRVVRDMAFSGFVALPSPEIWWRTLGLDSPNATPEQIEVAYKRLAMRNHPDRGGDDESMARINRARELGLEAIR